MGERVKANRAAHYDDLAAPGDFIFTGSNALPAGETCGMLFICPCGCGKLGTLEFSNSPDPEPGRTWEWDGNRDLPTLKPSIRQLGPCGWHGYLTDGYFERC